MKKVILIIFALLLTSCQSTVHTIEENTVYYEIFVGSFNDSDGDGMGDLNGITEKLDYIQELGATGLWLMPIHPSPTYHKYDVVDYYEIDPAYGTLEDFENLTQELEARDMDLIIDLVLNHSSTKHPWFQKAVSGKINDTCDTIIECEYYHFSEESQPGWTELTTGIYYESVFWDQMPDLNLESQSLRHEIEEIVKFWFGKGVDGFRLDATTHFYRENIPQNIEFLKWFNDMVKTHNPDAYLVGEAWSADSIVTKMYESQVDSFFNFTLAQVSGSIVKSVNTSRGQALSDYIEGYQETITSYNPDARNAVFLSNHDNDRSAGYLSANLDKQKLAASLYLLMPGNVFIYYGEEISMKGSGRDENKRLPMVWSFDEPNTNPPTDADYRLEQTLSVKQALEDDDSLLNHYKKVLEIRNKYSSSFVSTEVTSLDLHPSVYALDHGDIIVLHNTSSEAVEVELEQYDRIEQISGSISTTNNTTTIQGYSSLVIVK